MSKIKVKLKKDIASRGAGFFDPDTREDIYPPVINGKPDINHVFDLKWSSFVAEKIKTGELIPVQEPDKPEVPSNQVDNIKTAQETITASESEDSKTENTDPVTDITLPVMVNGKKVSQVTFKSDAAEEEISQMVLLTKKVMKACGNKGIKKFVITAEAVEIEAV